eukprot:scaffold7111_cov126-Isochrysis_galbana.AAC.3
MSRRRVSASAWSTGPPRAAAEAMAVDATAALGAATATPAATARPLARRTRPRPYSTGRRRSAASRWHTARGERSRRHPHRSTGWLRRARSPTQSRCDRCCCSLMDLPVRSSCPPVWWLHQAKVENARRVHEVRVPERLTHRVDRAHALEDVLTRPSTGGCAIGSRASRDGDADAWRVGDGEEQRGCAKLLDLDELQLLRRSLVELDMPTKAAGWPGHLRIAVPHRALGSARQVAVADAGCGAHVAPLIGLPLHEERRDCAGASGAVCRGCVAMDHWPFRSVGALATAPRCRGYRHWAGAQREIPPAVGVGRDRAHDGRPATALRKGRAHPVVPAGPAEVEVAAAVLVSDTARAYVAVAAARGWSAIGLVNPALAERDVAQDVLHARVVPRKAGTVHVRKGDGCFGGVGLAARAWQQQRLTRAAADYFAARTPVRKGAVPRNEDLRVGEAQEAVFPSALAAGIHLASVVIGTAAGILELATNVYGARASPPPRARVARVAIEGEYWPLLWRDWRARVEPDRAVQVREGVARPAARSRIADNGIVGIGDVEAGGGHVRRLRQRLGVRHHVGEELGRRGATCRTADEMDVRRQIKRQRVALLGAVFQVEAVGDGVVRDIVVQRRTVCAVQRHAPVVRLVDGAARDRVPPEHVGLADAPQLDRRHPEHRPGAHRSNVGAVAVQEGVTARHRERTELKPGGHWIAARECPFGWSRVILGALYDDGAGEVGDLALVFGRRRMRRLEGRGQEQLPARVCERAERADLIAVPVACVLHRGAHYKHFAARWPVDGVLQRHRGVAGGYRSREPRPRADERSTMQIEGARYCYPLAREGPKSTDLCRCPARTVQRDLESRPVDWAICRSSHQATGDSHSSRIKQNRWVSDRASPAQDQTRRGRNGNVAQHDAQG